MTDKLEIINGHMDDELTESYAIWAKTSPSDLPFGRQLDSILPTCVYYPEEEWNTFNFRPPENKDLVGAWRDKEGEAFIFLLRATEGVTEDQGPDYQVLVSGKSELVRNIGKRIDSHKGSLEKLQRREIAVRKVEENFSEEINTKSIERFTAIVGIFSVIVNAFSFYLRSLPAPDLPDEFLTIYKWLISLVHIGALSLLLLIIALAFAYLVKFGFLLIQRRK
ncbi:MAG: hypothetical protein Q7U78_07735 [Gallionella sp.]|nr:hypothetical protein [Gallionella sp.]